MTREDFASEKDTRQRKWRSKVSMIDECHRTSVHQYRRPAISTRMSTADVHADVYATRLNIIRGLHRHSGVELLTRPSVNQVQLNTLIITDISVTITISQRQIIREVQADILPPSSHETLCLNAVTIRSLNMQFHSVLSDGRMNAVTEKIFLWVNSSRWYVVTSFETVTYHNIFLSSSLTTLHSPKQTTMKELSTCRLLKKKYRTLQRHNDCPRSKSTSSTDVRLTDLRINSVLAFRSKSMNRHYGEWLLTSTWESAIPYSGWINDTLYCPIPVQLRINVVSVSDDPSTAHCTNFIKMTLSWDQKLVATRLTKWRIDVSTQ